MTVPEWMRDLPGWAKWFGLSLAALGVAFSIVEKKALPEMSEYVGIFDLLTGACFVLAAATFAAGVLSVVYPARWRSALRVLRRPLGLGRRSKAAEERRRIERCARNVLTAYERLRSMDGAWRIALDSRQAGRDIEDSLQEYKSAIAAAEHFKGAGAHGEAWAAARAGMDVSVLPDLAAPALEQPMARIRALLEE